ncbi:MAG: hypothetical protein IK136_03750, partial [Oscillospiraceae bacterium]|nr:hypothetical protein [Oscillospiraceae bacterium]
ISLGSVFVSLLYLSASYYLLLDRIRLGLVICALRDVVLAVPLSAALGAVFGIHGLFAGFALASLAAWLLSSLFLRIRYGADAPLLLTRRERGKEALLYSLNVEPNAIVSTRDRIGSALAGHGYDSRTVNRVMLLFEELFMLIAEKNSGMTVQAECVLLLKKDRIRMITRDTGRRIDLADPDMAVDSLRSYIVSSVSNRITSQKQHLVAMSFNRNLFELSVTRAAPGRDKTP